MIVCYRTFTYCKYKYSVAAQQPMYGSKRVHVQYSSKRSLSDKRRSLSDIRSLGERGSGRGINSIDAVE
jgi:hypothetical protein